MNHHQVGRIARLLRHRERLRQVDVAHRAQVSRLTVMRLEAGQAGGLTLDGIAAVFQALGGGIDLRLAWQGAALDRLLDEGHARLSGRVLEFLRRQGWDTHVEVTFSVYGDRGSIDILAWHAASRTLLVVEIKTELGSVEGLLRPLDVKCRLAVSIARDRFGWQPARVGRLVVMPEDSTVRRQVARHARLIDVSLPHRSLDVRRWLRSPDGPLAGLWFLSEVRSTNLKRSPSAVRRIRHARHARPAPSEALGSRRRPTRPTQGLLRRTSDGRTAMRRQQGPRDAHLIGFAFARGSPARPTGVLRGASQGRYYG